MSLSFGVDAALLKQLEVSESSLELTPKQLCWLYRRDSHTVYNIEERRGALNFILFLQSVVGFNLDQKKTMVCYV